MSSATVPTGSVLPGLAVWTAVVAVAASRPPASLAGVVVHLPTLGRHPR